MVLVDVAFRWSGAEENRAEEIATWEGTPDSKYGVVQESLTRVGERPYEPGTIAQKEAFPGKRRDGISVRVESGIRKEGREKYGTLYSRMANAFTWEWEALGSPPL